MSVYNPYTEQVLVLKILIDLFSQAHLASWNYLVLRFDVLNLPIPMTHHRSLYYNIQYSDSFCCIKKLTFPSVLTKQCGVVPGMIDRWHHLLLLSLEDFVVILKLNPGEISVN